jgi:uncharacterized membrane protein YfcA
MTGFYGIGGGWLITPVLNILGLPMPYAIGTSLTYIVITSGLGTFRHRKFKNINFSVGIVIGIAAIAGILLGSKLISYWEDQGSVDTIVRYIYIFFLALVGTYMIIEQNLRFRVQERRKQKGFALFRIQISIDSTKYSEISVLTLTVLGILVGFLKSSMGVGGGLILLPLLMYVVKLPVVLAVGTSLFAVLVSGVTGAALYILSGKIDWSSVIYLIITTLPGVYLGSSATKRILPERIKLLFAVTVLGGMIAVLLKQINLSIVSNIVIFTVTFVSSGAILSFAYLKKRA